MQQETETSYNMGANTALSICPVLIHHVAMTFPPIVQLDQVLPLFGNNNSWTKARGDYGYRACVTSGGIRVYHHGREDMGIHVQMSGEACVNAEFHGIVENGDWPSWINNYTENWGVHFTRIDLAIDDRTGVLCMSGIESCVRQGYAAHRFGKSVKHENLLAGGISISFGSRKSDARVQIYDKAAEQHVDYHWIRVELQLRGERACQAAQEIAVSGTQCIPGIVKGFLDFKDPSSRDHPLCQDRKRHLLPPN